MKSLRILLLALLLPLSFAFARSEERARWIAVPESDPHSYAVYYFRKDFALGEEAAAPMRVRVSGDNRYKLYVNGLLLALGPSRSDLDHWNYDVIDLAPYLRKGKNWIVAKVINEGPKRPLANVSWRSAFMLQAEDEAAEFLATDKSWLCVQDKAFAPIKQRVKGYYAAGPGELLDMRSALRDWNEEELPSGHWQAAEEISRINPRETNRPCGDFPGWRLKPNELPQMELRPERFERICKAEGFASAPSRDFLSGKSPLIVPPRTNASVLLDMKRLTNAYPTLVFSRGKDAGISLNYAEALYDNKMLKGHRDCFEDRILIGRKDSVLSCGAMRQTFTPMSWRTYRYVRLDIQTSDEALSIDDLYGTFTGYPFVLKASVESEDSDLQKMMDIGWRTARLCAYETYMDCPYYEQLQYFGDSRIQALVSLYMTDDDRLVRKCLDMADWSRGSDGVTQSRYPSSLAQWIQPYALHYIYALHDYMMYGRDLEFVRSKLMSARTVLDYFSRYQGPDGRIPYLPGWNYTDYVEGSPYWDNGVAVGGSDGCNAVLDLQLLYALELAADLERELGMNDYVSLYQRNIDRLKESIQRCYWRADTGLYSDWSNADVYSQHSQALAILTGMVSGEEALALARKLESSSLERKTAGGGAMAQATIYFKFYVNQAMVKAGLGDNYLNWLDVWRDYMSLGMSTWGEMSNTAQTRSECHAWGSSPNIEVMRTVLGIDSASPGFRSVRIEPHLGAINEISGRMPHHCGEIAVQYKRIKRGGKSSAASGLKAVISLPDGISGHFVWNGSQYRLHSGRNELDL